MLRILLADNHAIVRRGVRDVIEAHPGWEVCGEASDGQHALDLALRERPDIAVVDVSLPTLNGVELTRRLHYEQPSVRVLLFTRHADDETVNAGLAAGARGYVLKTDTERHLEDAIAALEADRPYLSSELAAVRAAKARASTRPTGFTARELEVAQLIADGNSNKQIARRLNIGVKTVESHRGAAMRKAGVHTAVELVRFAIRKNLIKL